MAACATASEWDALSAPPHLPKDHLTLTLSLTLNLESGKRANISLIELIGAQTWIVQYWRWITIAHGFGMGTIIVCVILYNTLFLESAIIIINIFTCYFCISMFFCWLVSWIASTFWSFIFGICQSLGGIYMLSSLDWSSQSFASQSHYPSMASTCGWLPK